MCCKILQHFSPSLLPLAMVAERQRLLVVLLCARCSSLFASPSSNNFRENELEQIVKLTEETMLGGTGHAMHTLVRAEEIRDFTLGHETLAQLKPKVFHFLPGNKFDADPNAEHVGFFHGDVAAAGFHPAAKLDMGDDAPEGTVQLDARPILAALVNAVNEHTRMIEMQTRMLQLHTSMLRKDMARLTALESKGEGAL